MDKKLILMLSYSFLVFVTVFSLRVKNIEVTTVQKGRREERSKFANSLLMWQKFNENSFLVFLSYNGPKVFDVSGGRVTSIDVFKSHFFNDPFISITGWAGLSFVTVDFKGELLVWKYKYTYIEKLIKSEINGQWLSKKGYFYKEWYECERLESLVDKLEFCLESKLDKITAMMRHPSKKIFVAGDVNGKIILFPSISMVRGHENEIVSICWNHKNQNVFATLCKGGEVKIWNWENLSCLACFMVDSTGGHRLKIVGMDWNYHNANVLALCLSNGDVMVYDWTRHSGLGYLEHNFDSSEETSICKVGWHPAYESVLVTASSKKIKIWDYRTGNARTLCKDIFPGVSEICNFAWKKEPPFYLAVSSCRGGIKLLRISIAI